MWPWKLGTNSARLTSPKRERWEAYARFVYAVLLAVVFPFICWGQSGQPDHPHPGAHFVFAAAPEFHPLVPPSKTAVVEHSPQPNPAFAASAIQGIAGQSTPATLALFTLLLVFTSFLWRLFRPISQEHLFTLALGSAQSVPAPPFAPPRPTYPLSSIGS